MPYRAPLTYHAAPPAIAPPRQRRWMKKKQPDAAAPRKLVSAFGKEFSFTLRDEEREAARAYLTALNQRSHAIITSSTTELPPLPADPFPAIEAARYRPLVVEGEPQPNMGSGGQTGGQVPAAAAAGEGAGEQGEQGDGNGNGNHAAYLLALNGGIAAAMVEDLLPRWWVDEVLRPWVPTATVKLI